MSAAGWNVVEWLMVDSKNNVFYGKHLSQCVVEVECTEFLLCMFTAGYFRNMSNIDLNSVRLCFQVFLPDANKKFTHIVQPVVSQPIIDKSLFL